jgi:hypothetical protein
MSGGSNPGERRGGRQKGTPNKRSIAQTTREIVEASGKSGQLPLDYMLEVMRDPKADRHRRDDMAKAAAGYLHAKLASVEVGHSGTLQHEHSVEYTLQHRAVALGNLIAEVRLRQEREQAGEVLPIKDKADDAIASK